MALILTMTSAMLLGYICTVFLYYALIFVLTSSAPHFVSGQGHFRSGYLLINSALWLICVAVGTYLTATISAAWFPWLAASILGIVVILLTWKNPLEAQKQLMGLSRLLLTFASAVGAGLGYYLRLK